MATIAVAVRVVKVNGLPSTSKHFNQTAIKGDGAAGKADRGRRRSKGTSRAFDLLCQLSPQLLDFYQKIQRIRDDESQPYFCPNRLWDRELEDQLATIVGWHAPRDIDARLRTAVVT